MTHESIVPRTPAVACLCSLIVIGASSCRKRSEPEPGAAAARSLAAAPTKPPVPAPSAKTPPPSAATEQPLGEVQRVVERASASPLPAADAAALPVLTVSELMPAAPADACPAGMQYVRGGEFWMGSPRGRGAPEERPRFQTKVADFCLDAHEVTTAKYAACVARGVCTAPQGSQRTCNYGRREDHPINCVDWTQAETYCQSVGSRLPTELEWEYSARGGERYQTYSWGDESPDGRTCWKTNHSCKVGSFEPGAFGLHDMSGNVWEWTHDWFGDYPWPRAEGRHKVFRGGSWSRRFDKWMRTTLRNRTSPDSWGSHLGFRCARLAKEAKCPFGEHSEPGLCRHGVIDAECEDPRQHFNGLRCAIPGDAGCRDGYAPKPGYGCVATTAPRVRGSGGGTQSSPEELDVSSITRARSPEFDADCRDHQPARPHAYSIRGGTHLARNHYGAELGCKNRDVGVGWNSACCR